MRVPGLLVLAACLTAAACGGGGTPALSVEEAADHRGAAEVTGFLHAVGETVRLCAAVLESFPPQCGQPSLRVEGLQLTDVEGLQRSGTVAWREGMTVTGTVDGGVVTAD